MPESPSQDLFEPRMPQVDESPDIANVFDQARVSAAGNAPSDKVSRQLVLITPGRQLMLQPCPHPGSMAPAVVKQVEKLISPKVKRKIAVIAFTDVKAMTSDLAKTIPFVGMLIGMAYTGHAVWIFEGHSSALAAGCKDADLLIVDSGMLPHLPSDWRKLAASHAPKMQIYVHDRADNGLRQLN